MKEITSLVMAEDVAVLLSYAASEEKAETEYKKYITLRDRQLYGFMDGEAMGGCIGIEIVDADVLEIKHIAVAPEQRGSGLGRAMIQAVQGKLKPNVMVAETDLEAVGFYRSLGFEIRSLGEKYPGVERFLCRLEKL